MHWFIIVYVQWTNVLVLVDNCILLWSHYKIAVKLIAAAATAAAAADDDVDVDVDDKEDNNYNNVDGQYYLFNFISPKGSKHINKHKG